MHFVLFEWISFQIYIRRQFFGKFCSVTQNTTAKIEKKIEIFLIFFWIFQKFSLLYWLSYSRSPSKIRGKISSNKDSEIHSNKTKCMAETRRILSRAVQYEVKLNHRIIQDCLWFPKSFKSFIGLYVFLWFFVVS